MKANEFVKKFGWEYAFNAVNLHHTQPYAIAVTVYDGTLSYAVSMSCGFTYISDLKCLVESWDLVEFYGGLDEAKSLHYDEFILDKSYNELQQAIKDIESCK